MLEVRSHNQDYLLEQFDFDFIDTMCGLKFLDLMEEGDKTDYSMKGGLSQGGVWIACKNQATLDLVREYAGTLHSPEDIGGQFKVFGEGEKPYKYLQAWIPNRWWNHRARLEALIRHTHANKYLTNPLEDGQIPHFRLSSGLLKKKSNDAGFFEVTFEIDENLFPVIAKNRGQFDIAMSTVKFFGSGLVAEAKRMIGEEYDQMLDINTE